MAGVKINGALFKNKKRKEGSKQPEYTGVITVTPDFARDLFEAMRNAGQDGVKVYLSSWLKEKNGDKYFSISGDFGAASQGDGQRARPAQRGNNNQSKGGFKSNDPFDDDIPFD